MVQAYRAFNALPERARGQYSIALSSYMRGDTQARLNQRIRDNTGQGLNTRNLGVLWREARRSALAEGRMRTLSGLNRMRPESMKRATFRMKDEYRFLVRVRVKESASGEFIDKYLSVSDDVNYTKQEAADKALEAYNMAERDAKYKVFEGDISFLAVTAIRRVFP